MMSKPSTGPEQKLRILHVLRAPSRGLFRHVIDLTREQIARGHSVGLVTDSITGGARGYEVLGALAPALELGLLRIPMRRPAHLLDLPAVWRVAHYAAGLNVDVIHGHGSKGGAYARLPALLPLKGNAVRAYTPHGGSFNYRSAPLVERAYMAAERLMVGGAYASAIMDRLTTTARYAPTPADRRRWYARVQCRAARDLPVVPLWWEDRVVVHRDSLEGFEPAPSGELRGLAAGWMR